MKKTGIALGIVLALALVCSTASATSLHMALVDGSVHNTEATAYKAAIGEVIEVAIFVTDVSHLSGFDAFITTDDIGIPGGAHTDPLEWVVVGTPVLADIGAWFVSAAEGAGKTGIEGSGTDASVFSLTALMAKAETEDAYGNPIPIGDQDEAWVSGSGAIAFFTVRHINAGLGYIGIDTALTVLGDDLADEIAYTYAGDVDGPTGGIYITTIPEPATMALLGAGLLGLVVRRRRK